MVLQISLHFNSNLLKNSTAIENSSYAKQSGGGGKKNLLAIFTKSEKMSLAHRFGTSLTLAENSS